MTTFDDPAPEAPEAAIVRGIWGAGTGAGDRVDPPALIAVDAPETGAHTAPEPATRAAIDALMPGDWGGTLAVLSASHGAGAAGVVAAIGVARAQIAVIDAVLGRDPDPARVQTVIDDAVERAQTTPLALGDTLAAAIRRYYLIGSMVALGDAWSRFLTGLTVDLTAFAQATRAFLAWVRRGEPRRPRPRRRPIYHGRAVVPYLHAGSTRFSLRVAATGRRRAVD